MKPALGTTATRTWNNPAWANQNDLSTTEEAKTYLFQGGNDPISGQAVLPSFTIRERSPAVFYGLRGFDVGSISPVWDYADTIRWTHGKHSFSFGGEYRRPMTTGFNGSGYATSTPGNPTGAPAQDLDRHQPISPQSCRVFFKLLEQLGDPAQPDQRFDSDCEYGILD